MVLLFIYKSRENYFIDTLVFINEHNVNLFVFAHELVMYLWNIWKYLRVNICEILKNASKIVAALIKRKFLI